MNSSTGNLSWLNSLAEAWWSWMMPVSFQVLVLLVVVYSIDRVLGRKAWPKLLSALWVLVFIKLVLPPTLTSPTSLAHLVDFSCQGTATTHVVNSDTHGTEANEVNISPGAADTKEVAMSTGIPTRTESLQPDLAQTQSWQTAIPLVSFLVWISGCFLLGLIAFRRYRRVSKLISPTNQLEVPARVIEQLARCSARLNMRSIPRLIVVDATVGPAVFGVIRPVIVLPAALLHTASPAELEHVLLHELSHIKRRDPCWDFAALVLSLIYWIHPGVWFARRRLTAVRELRCDETVAAALGEQAPEYRRTLLTISGPLWAPAGLAFFPRRSQLLERIEHLSQSPANSRGHRLAVIAVVAVVVSCVIPLSADESAAEFSEHETNAATGDNAKSNEVATSVGRESTDKDLAARVAEQLIQQPEATPVSYEMPPLDELQGCMQLRYAVFAEMARRAKSANPNP